MSSEYLFKAIKADVGDAGEKLLLCILADIANEKGQCWPSIDYLTKCSHLSESTAHRKIKSLQDRGIIGIHRRRKAIGLNDSNLYQLKLDDLSEHTVTMTPSTCQDDSLMVSPRQSDGVTVTPNTPNRYSYRDTHIRPTLEDVKNYVSEKGLKVDPEYFYEYYDGQGWVDTKGNPVKNWKLRAQTWSKRESARAPTNYEGGFEI